jgi:hypothetical protein
MNEELYLFFTQEEREEYASYLAEVAEEEARLRAELNNIDFNIIIVNNNSYIDELPF